MWSGARAGWWCWSAGAGRARCRCWRAFMSRWPRRPRSPARATGALSRLERIVDGAAVAPRIEALLPVGVRPRQLSVRTLLLGMLLVAIDGRPAHLTRVHRALVELPDDQRRLGIIADWDDGPH